MRIKVATQIPLPKYQCWFGITENLEKKTIHHLRKRIAKDLKLECEPANMKLLLDDYVLLPQTSIASLVRDGDLITVKEEVIKKKTVTSKKRKSSSTTEEKKKDDIEARPIKKTKTSKKHKEKDIKIEKVTKKDTKVEKVTNKDTKLSIKPEKLQGKPFQGIDRTKKRNMRRRLLKKSLRDATATTITPTPIITPVTTTTDLLAHPELQVEKLNISEPISTHLLKQNKNKNKHHLKKADKVAENRLHVQYSDKPVDITETMATETVVAETVAADKTVDMNHGNRFGRAFVTLMESDPNCKGRRGPVHKYPIHRVPTLFYAEEAMEEEPVESEPMEEEPVTQKSVVEPSSTPSLGSAPVNYDSLPDADFIKNIPSIGALLAIKTLELTANYTPEISDWKQVILKALNSSTATFEYQQGFGKASTKGGKFDVKKHRKKIYDDWGNEIVDEDEELQDDSAQDDQDMITTIPIADVFAMKNMLKE